MAVEIREIADEDLAAVVTLLSEGFPAKDSAYWQQSVSLLGQRPMIEPYPRYGYMLVVDGAPQGVILLLTARYLAGIRSNLSSWYVRPGYRNFASFLFQRSLKTKGGTYLNVSPAPHVLSIVQAFGFKPYTAGTYLLDPSQLFHTSASRVRRFDAETPGMSDGETVETLRRHEGFGCVAITIEDAEGLMPALYRVRMLRGVVPVACFLWGAPERLVRNRGALVRWLLARGIAAAFVDAPIGVPVRGVRHFPDKGVRYVKGKGEVPPGDLRDTEMAIFGP